jgi:hypothetical protein
VGGLLLWPAGVLARGRPAIISRAWGRAGHTASKLSWVALRAPGRASTKVAPREDGLRGVLQTRGPHRLPKSRDLIVAHRPHRLWGAVAGVQTRAACAQDQGRVPLLHGLTKPRDHLIRLVRQQTASYQLPGQL